jgi:hypothetical protein
MRRSFLHFTQDRLRLLRMTGWVARTCLEGPRFSCPQRSSVMCPLTPGARGPPPAPAGESAGSGPPCPARGEGWFAQKEAPARRDKRQSKRRSSPRITVTSALPAARPTLPLIVIDRMAGDDENISGCGARDKDRDD